MIFSSYIVYIEGSEVIFSKQMTLFARVPVKWFPVSEGIYSPLTYNRGRISSQIIEIFTKEHNT